MPRRPATIQSTVTPEQRPGVLCGVALKRPSNWSGSTTCILPAWDVVDGKWYCYRHIWRARYAAGRVKPDGTLPDGVKP